MIVLPLRVYGGDLACINQLLVQNHLLRRCIDGAPLLRASHYPPTCQLVTTSGTPYCALHVAGVVPVGAVNGYGKPMALGGSMLLYIYSRYGAALVQVPHLCGQGACCTVDDGTVPVYRFEGSSG